METYNKKSVSDNLKKYCYFADDDSFIEVTQWKNGEGYDINIESHNSTKLIGFTNGELEAISYLVKVLEYNE